jgi:hypothetical protein
VVYGKNGGITERGAERDVESFVGGKWGWYMGWRIQGDSGRILGLSWKTEKLIYKKF